MNLENGKRLKQHKTETQNDRRGKLMEKGEGEKKTKKYNERHKERRRMQRINRKKMESKKKIQKSGGLVRGKREGKKK